MEIYKNLEVYNKLECTFFPIKYTYYLRDIINGIKLEQL